MKASTITHSVKPTASCWALLSIALLATAQAQNVILAPEAEALLTPAQRKVAPPPLLSRPPSGPETPYQLGGVFVLHPRLSFSQMWTDGLPIQGQGSRGESNISTLSAGLTLDAGDNWSLDYSPSRVNYSNDSLADSTQQSVRIRGDLSAQDWSINFNQSYNKSNQIIVETARQTDRKNLSTQLGGSYRYSPKLHLSLSGGLNDSTSSQTAKQRSYSVQGSVGYLLSAQLTLSVNPAYNYTEVDAAPDYASQSLSALISWQPAEKVTLSLGAGFDSRSTKASAGLDETTPLLNFALSYAPFETTSLSLTYARSSSASFFSSQATDNRNLSISLSQRLLGRFYIAANYAKSRRDYQSLVNNLAVNREDDVEALSFRLSTRFLKRLTASLIHQESKNRSNLAAFGYSSQQSGFEIGYSY